MNGFESSSQALLPPRNFAVVERQFLLKYTVFYKFFKIIRIQHGPVSAQKSYFKKRRHKRSGLMGLKFQTFAAAFSEFTLCV